MASTSQDATPVRSCLHYHPPLVHQHVSDANCFFSSGGCQDGHTNSQRGPDHSLADHDDAPRYLSESRDIHDKGAWMSWQHGPWSFAEQQAVPGDSQGSCPSWTWEAVPFNANHVPRSGQDEPPSTDQLHSSGWSSATPQQSHQAMPGQATLWSNIPATSECYVLSSRGHQQHPNAQSFQANHADFEFSQNEGDEDEHAPDSMSQYCFSSALPSNTQDNYYAERPAINSWALSNETREAPWQTYMTEVTTPGAYNPAHSWFSNLPESSPSTIGPAIRQSPSASNWSTEDSVSLSMHTGAACPADLIPEPPTTLVDPPTEDMHPEDIALMPQRRNLKDPDHLYMPRWTRGHGKQREAWCGACRPGCWLSLKRSTYWYHKNFCHGITVSGTAFPRPTRVQKQRDEKGYEGLCGNCGKWVPLNGGKKSHTSWFRHAYKCGSMTPRSSPSKAPSR